MNEPVAVPEHLLEQLSAGDLPMDQHGRVLEDLKREPGGMDRLERLKRSNADILERYPVKLMAAQIRYRHEMTRPKTKRRAAWTAGFVGAAAACAAGLVIVLSFGETPVPEQEPFTVLPSGEYIGFKGSPQLSFHKKDRGRNVSLVPGVDTAREGDVLMLSYNAKGAPFGVIFSVDGRGSVTLHFPSDEAGSTELEAGGPKPLEFAYELDDAPDFEDFYLIWGKDPIDARSVMGAAKEMVEEGRDAPRLPEGLHHQRYTLKKPRGSE